MGSEFHGKNVLITGASSGIGAGLARAFAREKANLVLLARRADRLKALESELKAYGIKVLALTCDVTRDGDFMQILGVVHQELGPLDVVIANAGFGVVGKVEKLTLEDYRRQFETNVMGVLRTVQATLEDLKKTKGRLAIMGSVNGFVAIPGNSPYGMSKAAVRSLWGSLKHELRQYGISVTHIAPGYVESEIFYVDNHGHFHPGTKDPIPKWIRVRTEIAVKEMMKAIARRKSQKVVTGHGRVVVFIACHFPWLIDLFVAQKGIQSRSEPGKFVSH